jgi:RNA polymerase sigma factor (sigma-70 family)
MTNSLPEEMLSMGEQRASTRREARDSMRAELVDIMFRRHYAALLRLAVVMVGDREAAEDAVQDAFVSLHRNLSSLRDPEAAEAYLRSSTLNRCRSWVRRQATQRAKRPLLLVREGPPRTPEDATVFHDEVGSLVSAMRTLPRRQRETLACRFVLELSVAETAELLDVSEGSVKTHTHRGLHALQQRIEVNR